MKSGIIDGYPLYIYIYMMEFLHSHVTVDGPLQGIFHAVLDGIVLVGRSTLNMCVEYVGIAFMS